MTEKETETEIRTLESVLMKAESVISDEREGDWGGGGGGGGRGRRKVGLSPGRLKGAERKGTSYIK